MIALCAITATLLDKLLGEPGKYHPLVGLGAVINRVEQSLWVERGSKIRGAIALALVLLLVMALLTFLLYLLSDAFVLTLLLSVTVVYVAIAPRSLAEHAEAVSEALESGNLDLARARVAQLVSRDTAALSEQEIAAACCESILENGSDGVCAAIFWFTFVGFLAGGDYTAGLYGIVLYRTVNTLDAMWGYKTARYREFGWAAARADDALNALPAVLVALSYALMGRFSASVKAAITQGPSWKSPNAGLVMAAGAASLGIRLGGKARYFSRVEDRPDLGWGESAGTADIANALALVHRTLVLWLVVIAFLDVGLAQ